MEASQNSFDIKKCMDPRNWIQNPQVVHQNTCKICYDVLIKPAKCLGPCGSSFCTKCVSTWKQTVDRCPMRCSAPFRVTIVSNSKIQFICPFNPEKCLQQISNLIQFENHYTKCQFVTKPAFQARVFWKNSLCMKGHPLEFFVGTEQQMRQAMCALCGDVGLARYYCRVCNKFYCVRCREIKCSKKSCPKGHGFVLIGEVKNNTCTCNICGNRIGLIGKGTFYDDKACNFQVCEVCYITLPKEQININVNNSNQCDKGHNLFGIQKFEETMCSHCKQVKYCNRICLHCKKYYCGNCKILLVDFKNRCHKKHIVSKYCQIRVYDPKKLGKNNDIPLTLEHQVNKCSRCLVKFAVWEDKICRFKFCNDCLKYSGKIQIYEDQRRIEGKFCNKMHPLEYNRNYAVKNSLCVACRVYKQCLITCFYCGWSDYCSKCRKPPKGTCYKKHELTVELKVKSICHVCEKDRDKVFTCAKDCSIQVCIDCSLNK